MMNLIEKINLLVRSNKVKPYIDYGQYWGDVPKEPHEMTTLEIWGLAKDGARLESEHLYATKESVLNSKPHTWWLQNPDVRVVKFKLVEDKSDE